MVLAPHYVRRTHIDAPHLTRGGDIHQVTCHPTRRAPEVKDPSTSWKLEPESSEDHAHLVDMPLPIQQIFICRSSITDP